MTADSMNDPTTRRFFMTNAEFDRKGLEEDKNSRDQRKARFINASRHFRLQSRCIRSAPAAHSSNVPQL